MKYTHNLENLEYLIFTELKGEDKGKDTKNALSLIATGYFYTVKEAGVCTLSTASPWQRKRRIFIVCLKEGHTLLY